MPPSENAPLPSRVANALAVYEGLRRAPLRTRAELAEESGLSKPTVGAALQVLVHGRLIRERGHAVGRRGPRAILYESCHGEPAVLAIDIGRHRVRGVVADVDGRPCLTAEVPVKAPNSEDVLHAVKLMQERFAGISLEVAIAGSPGVVDPANGKIRLCSEIAGWNGMRLEAALVDIVGCDVVVENDVNLAAIGEHYDGAGRGCDSFVYLAMSSVIAAGLILDGRLHRGRHGAAGLLSFLPFAPRLNGDSKSDGDDRSGLRRLDARPDLPPLARLISRDAIIALARMIDPDFDYEMYSVIVDGAAGAAGVGAAGGVASVDGTGVASVDGMSAASGMGVADGLGGRDADHVPASLGLPLAAVIAAVTAITDIELVLLGGDQGARAGQLIAPALVHLSRLVPYTPQIVVAELGDRATLRGAAARGSEIARERMVSRAIQELAAAQA